MYRMTAQQRVTLAQFIELRLGESDNFAVLLKRMLALSFGAGSFRDFWRYWNPVYGYYLLYYCYTPLGRILPRWLCVIITFACSGFFLHDFPFGWWIRALKNQSLPVPFVALWFSTIGIIVLVAEAVKLDLKSFPLPARVFVNVLHLAGPFLLVFYLLQ